MHAICEKLLEFSRKNTYTSLQAIYTQIHTNFKATLSFGTITGKFEDFMLRE